MKSMVLNMLVLCGIIHGLTAKQTLKRHRREQPAASNTTSVRTKHDDIVHFKCTTLDQVASITWKRETKDLSNSDLGVAILVTKNNGTMESHLFIAVTDDDLRGKYTCMSSSKPDAVLRTFIIENDPAREGKLSTEEYWAIILSLAIGFILLVFIAIFLWRGSRRIKKAQIEVKAQRSRNNHREAQENLAVEEEILDCGENNVEADVDSKEKIKPETVNGKRNNNVGNGKEENMTEVVIESPGKKGRESCTQF